MRGYIASLTRDLELHRATATQAKPHPPAYTPLRDQLHQLLASLPRRQLNRPWRLSELQALLKGRYRDKPKLSMLADELRRLHWQQKRDWTSAGAGARYWVPPATTN